MKKIVLVAFAAVAALTVNAQTFTEGKIVTKITYPDLDENSGIVAMLPKEHVMYVKGDKAMMEQPGAMGSKTIILIDNKKKETHTYLDLMGKKYDIVQNQEEIEEANKKTAGDFTITETTETKTIAGYTCKKATVKTKDGEEGEIWYCPELTRPDGNWSSPYKGVNGMLMEFSITKPSQMGDMTMKMTVTEVSKETVPDAKMKAPEGTWTKMTMAEFMKAMGGN